MNKKSFQILFIAFALLAFAAMVYHIIGAIKPFPVPFRVPTQLIHWH
jgi:hypothetical protein